MEGDQLSVITTRRHGLRDAAEKHHFESHPRVAVAAGCFEL
jgi:hypothetical protein